MARFCSKCKKLKEDHEISTSTGIWCKDCTKEYDRRRHYNNRIVRRAQTKANRERVRRWFKDYRKTLQCMNCGENHPACLDFHHKDPKEKEFDVSFGSLRGYGISSILKEIEKCIVICANCHRKLHYSQ